jgi:hypothetical protein
VKERILIFALEERAREENVAHKLLSNLLSNERLVILFDCL